MSRPHDNPTSGGAAPAANQSVLVPRALLHRIYEKMLDDYDRISVEWGASPGGLEGDISRGKEPQIASVRALLALPMESIPNAQLALVDANEARRLDSAGPAPVPAAT